MAALSQADVSPAATAEGWHLSGDEVVFVNLRSIANVDLAIKRIASPVASRSLISRFLLEYYW